MSTQKVKKNVWKIHIPNMQKWRKIIVFTCLINQNISLTYAKTQGECFLFFCNWFFKRSAVLVSISSIELILILLLQSNNNQNKSLDTHFFYSRTSNFQRVMDCNTQSALPLYFFYKDTHANSTTTTSTITWLHWPRLSFLFILHLTTINVIKQ